MRFCHIFPKTTVFEDPMVFGPLGQFYIRAVLEQHGYETEFIDMSDYERTVDGQKIELYPNVTSLPLDYDIYLVGGTSPQAREIRKICRFLKGEGKFIIAGGPHVSNYAGRETGGFGLPLVSDLLIDEELVKNAHVLVKYEGEAAVLEAVEYLKTVEGLHRNLTRAVVIQRPNIDDLGLVPIPDRRAAMRYHYYLEDEHGRKHRGTTMFSSRGCPEECRFCDSPGLWGRRVRYTPLHRIVEEFEQIRLLGFEAIHFYDDILPLNKIRMAEMCRLLKEFGFIWRCFLRVDIISKYGKEFLEMMYESGCREVLVGVESGSQKLLDIIHKNTTVEQNTLVCRWCREVGIRFKASIILGLPGESMETMEMTRRWVLENRPDKINLCIFVPFTGTPIAKTTEAARRKVYGDKGNEVYDIHWDVDAAQLDEEFFAGGWDTLKPMVYTSKVSKEEIGEFYHMFIADLEKAGISH